MVGTSIGAGQRERALRAAWIGAAMAFVLTEAIGLCAAAFPTPWLSLFDTDPQMLEAGAHYLRTVGPFYGLFGLGLVALLRVAGRRPAAVAAARHRGAPGDRGARRLARAALDR